MLEVGIKLEKENSDNMLYNRRMTIAVSRYLSQANNLIYNVERGVFPSITSFKKEDGSDD